MITGHKIEKKVEIQKYLDMIQEFKEEEINTTNHTFFRLKEEERKIFKERVIKEFILNQIPILIGIQYNKNYAVFYKYGKDILKLIIDIKSTKINIVTFYIMDKKQMPKI